MSRYKGIRFFAYFLEILVLFMVQETPGLMPSVYGVRPTLLIPAALLIASNPGSGTIMSLVENAWGIFGASFGPVIVLSLFWRGFTFSGAAAGIVAGAVVDVLWLVLFKSTGVYEIVPGFAAGLLAAVIASKCSSAESRESAAALFDACIAYKD